MLGQLFIPTVPSTAEFFLCAFPISHPRPPPETQTGIAQKRAGKADKADSLGEVAKGKKSCPVLMMMMTGQVVY